jgi:2'-5' RNA ligase
MNQTMRLFIAIQLPEPVKAVLLQTAAQMGHHLPAGAVRWLKPEQMHLTLRFLGDTAVAQLPALQNQLTQLTNGKKPFRLQLNGVGAFPNRRKPRVLWAGLAGELAALQLLQKELEERVMGLGWPEEKRPFNPHLTLGRVKDARKVQALHWEVNLAALEIEVAEVCLVMSELRPSGAFYSVRHIAQLV